MKLKLSIISFHRYVSEVKSEFVIELKNDASIKFGRSRACDWVLPDPDRVISSTHGKILLKKGRLSLIDLSTNGIYLNHSSSPLGKNNSVELSHKDTMTFGEYEVEIINEDIFNETTLLTGMNSVEQADTLTANVEFEHQVEGAQPPLLNSHDALPNEIGFSDEFFDVDILKTPKNDEDSLDSEAKENIKQTSCSCTNCAAFMEGLGLSATLEGADSEQWFKEIGSSYSLLLTGLMELLHNRVAFKQLNRLNHTAFKKAENNPLKFSADVNDAINNLFNRKSPSFLSPDKAIAEAFADIDKHERALLKGMDGAVTSVLALLSPERLYTEDVSSSFFNIKSKNEKYKSSWQNFLLVHRRLDTEINQSERPFYLDDFAKYYDLELRQ